MKAMTLNRKTAVVALAAAGVLSTLASGPAQASPSTSSTGAASQAAAVRGWHGFDDTYFKGPHAWFDGNVGQCRYIGDGWNDRINSARTESSRTVELWEHGNCTGYSITIDKSGYGKIGNWVSAYRIH